MMYPIPKSILPQSIQGNNTHTTNQTQNNTANTQATYGNVAGKANTNPTTQSKKKIKEPEIFKSDLALLRRGRGLLTLGFLILVAGLNLGVVVDFLLIQPLVLVVTVLFVRPFFPTDVDMVKLGVCLRERVIRTEPSLFSVLVSVVLQPIFLVFFLYAIT